MQSKYFDLADFEIKEQVGIKIQTERQQTTERYIASESKGPESFERKQHPQRERLFKRIFLKFRT